MALEIFAAVVPEIVKKFMDETIHQASYPFRFKKYVKDLAIEKQNLLLQRGSVRDRVTTAKEDAQIVDNLVMTWLDEADKLIVDAGLLEERAETNKSCCLGHCRDLIWQFHLAKQIEKKMKEIVDQGKKCNFPQFARPAAPPGIAYYSSEGFILFDSTKLAYHQLLEALKADEVSMIGLYGMGGCGKTTLAKQVGKAVMELFSRVVFVVVSSFVDILKIQDSIASQLGFTLEGQGDQGKAQSLWSRLNNSAGKILIILDDVWEKLDFEAIGIPFDSNFKRCKVLLTTRRKPVCTLMNCQRIVDLHLLDEQEAWRLFQHYACISSLTPDNMKVLAKEIAYECKGLAIAIATVASTLKGKNLVEWEEALETLRESAWLNVEQGLRDPYKCLLLSYDNLNDEAAKLIFLLCSVFPEDFEIDEEDLARYGIGLGLLARLNSFRRARNRLSIAKDKLIDSCLLMKIDDGEHVKMHDLVRDVALWIAKEENREIASGQRSVEIIKACGLVEDNKIRYLWLDHVNSFPSQLHFSNLIFLHVSLEEESVLTCDCFKALLELRVLVLKTNRYCPFLGSLTINLHCLHLEGWELGDISFVVSLKKLQSLTLRNCSFNNLPSEIIDLESFKLLDVRGCDIKENPYKVMGRCSNLEELYFVDNSEWVDEQDHACDIFGREGDSLKLQRYRVEIGKNFRLDEYFWTSIRSIAVEHFDVSTANETIKDLVRRAERLCLEKIYRGCKNVIPEMMIERIGRTGDLTELFLDDCEDLEFFVDLANCGADQFENVFSKLIKLQIKNMKSLKAFCRGAYPKANHMLSMCNLKVFKLSNCSLLTHVFTFAIAESLAMLEQLDVEDCDGLKHIVTDEMQHNQQRSGVVFQNLKWLSVSKCKQMEYLITMQHNVSQSFELANLNDLELCSLPDLISMFSDNYYPRCSSLGSLMLEGCDRLNIKSLNDLAVGRTTSQELGPIITQSTQMSDIEATQFQTLQSLEDVDIRDCSHIEYVFQLNEEQTPLESSLSSLTLYQLSELRCIFKGPTQCISLQQLWRINIVGCKELKSIFTVSIVRGLPQLRSITIERCDKLELIIEEEEFTCNLGTPSNSSSTPVHRSQNIGSFNLCRLWRIEVRDCPKLKWLFTLSTAINLTSLEWLTIERCGGLEYVIKEDVRVDGKAILPNLTRLTIKECDKLEQIIGGEESFDSLETASNLSAPPPHRSQNTENYYLGCSSLEFLKLEGCGRLNIKSLNDLVVGRTTSQELGPIITQSTQMSDIEATQFQTLQHVEVSDIRELKSIFTVSIVRGLPPLNSIIVARCDKLELIIEEEEFTGNLETTSNSSSTPLHRSQNIGSFNLCSLGFLIVRDCPKLKWLFTLSTAKTLTSLEWLRIERCEGLEYIIKEERVEGNKSDAIVDDDGQAMLSRLEDLYLIDVPNLIEVYRGFQFHYVDYEVENCPKLIPQPPERTTKSKDDEEEELRKDSEEEKAVEEENKLVPYDPNKAAKSIILESEFSLQGTSNFNGDAGPSGEAAPELPNREGGEIPGLPMRPSISVRALPLEADPLSSSVDGERAAFRDGYLDRV